MIKGLQIEPLALHPKLIPELEALFELEWPDYYGAAGRGNAREDLQAYANLSGLPFGVVALRDGSVCGVAALKADSIAARTDLSPWAAAGLVRRDLRGQGIGEQLVAALERQAKAMGFRRIYCGTNTAESLLRRTGWRLLERIDHDGEVLAIYDKAL